MIKRIFQHIEIAHAGILFGFLSLGIALFKDYGIVMLLVVWVVGVVLALSAAHNAYITKSTALIDNYDERFFEKMSRQRKSAALFLLGENSNSDELEDVLDFFESPIAKKVNEGCIDAEQVYDTFYHWIRLYLQASLNFREEYRKDEHTAYTNLAELYAQTSQFEQREIEKETGRTCKLDDLLLTQKKLTTYLQQEANLKTEASDWENIFRRES